jgi:glycosyltransferase involved in cell wall biosynthesis
LRIAVIVPAFNAESFVADAIRSVLTQTNSDTRLIVVDDGSADATSAIVAEFTDPRLNLIRQPNAGVSAARNRGIQAADADALLFLDADDWLAPDALTRLAAGLKVAPRAVAAVGAYAIVGWKSAAHSNRATADGASLIRPTSRDLLPRLLVRNLFVNGGHLLIRRNAIRKIGGFAPHLTFGEDWEDWIRIALQGGFTFLPQPQPVLFVRSRADGAYRGHAADPDAFRPCMAAIWSNPALAARFGPACLADLRRRAEAENAWIVGREQIRLGRGAEGRAWLRHAVAQAPTARRLALVAAAHALPLLPARCRGPFRPYPVTA